MFYYDVAASATEEGATLSELSISMQALRRITDTEDYSTVIEGTLREPPEKLCMASRIFRLEPPGAIPSIVVSTLRLKQPVVSAMTFLQCPPGEGEEKWPQTQPLTIRASGQWEFPGTMDRVPGEQWLANLAPRACSYLMEDTSRAEVRARSEWTQARLRIREERHAYEGMKDAILAQFEGQYVAVWDGRVVDHDADYGELARRVYSRIGRKPVLLTRATRERQIAHVSAGLASR